MVNLQGQIYKILYWAKVFIMKRYNSFLLLWSLALLGLLSFSACKDKESPRLPNTINPLDTLTNFSGLVVPSTGTLQFHMNYLYDNAAIQFGTKYYTNAAGDTFTINELRHYLSNVTLSKVGGGEVNLGNYALLNARDLSAQSFTISNVPAGNYNKISFLLAVDSAKNHGGLQEGALDPAWGMFWTWSTGYIFFRINGNTTTGTNFSFDLGGDENIARVKNDFSNVKVKSTNAKIEMNMEISEMFKNPAIYSFKTDGYAIHSGVEPAAYKLSANMNDLVTIKSILP
jgi:hypothetical protein